MFFRFQEANRRIAQWASQRNFETGLKHLPAHHSGLYADSGVATTSLLLTCNIPFFPNWFQANFSMFTFFVKNAEYCWYPFKTWCVSEMQAAQERARAKHQKKQNGNNLETIKGDPRKLCSYMIIFTYAHTRCKHVLLYLHMSSWVFISKHIFWFVHILCRYFCKYRT